jgi:hypothetical protein
VSEWWGCVVFDQFEVCFLISFPLRLALRPVQDHPARHNGRRQEVFLSPGGMIVHAVKHMGGEDNCDNSTTYEQRLIIGENWCCVVYVVYLLCYFVSHSLICTSSHYLLLRLRRRLPALPRSQPRQTVERVHVHGERCVVLVYIVLEDIVLSKVEVRFVPGTILMAGYETTAHSRQGDISREWREFKLSDCAVPGVRSDGK